MTQKHMLSIEIKTAVQMHPVRLYAMLHTVCKEISQGQDGYPEANTLQTAGRFKKSPKIFDTTKIMWISFTL